MGVTIEKELRGPLDMSTCKNISTFADQNGWKKHSYKQVTIYCNTDNIPSIGTVTRGKGRLSLDIRDDVLKIKLKVGNALEFSRNQYVTKCTKDSWESIAALLKIFGVTTGFGRTFDRTDFVTPNGVKLTVKLHCNMGDHFELERNDDDPSTLTEFNKILNELQLYVWDKDEYAAAIQHDHDTVTETEIATFLKNEL